MDLFFTLITWVIFSVVILEQLMIDCKCLLQWASSEKKQCRNVYGVTVTFNNYDSSEIITVSLLAFQNR